MRRALGILIAVLALCGSAQAQDIRSGPSSGTSSASSPQTFLPVSYGAICNAVTHPISGTNLPQTVAGLAAYTVNGTTPYSWLTDGTRYFRIAMPVLGGAANGASNLTVYSVTGLAAGMIVTSTTTGAIPTNDTIASVHAASGSALPYITLTSPLTAALPVYQVSTTNTNYIEIKQASGTQMTDAQVAASEVDWLAIQSAYEAAKTAGGGTVVLPATTCVMDNASSPGTGAGTLVLDAQASDINWSGTGVNIVSTGTPINAILNWPTDLGAGRIEVSDDIPWADPANALGRYAYAAYYGVLQDFQILGPQPTFTLGAAPTVAATGYAQGARKRLIRVAIRGNYNGVSYIGDHSPWLDDEFNANQNFNIYEDYPNSALGGDDDCLVCQVSGSGLAGFGVNYATTLNLHMVSGYVGDNPYAIYGEGTPAGGPSIGMIGNASFKDMNWEWNAGQIYDATGDTYTYSNGAVASVTIGTKGRSVTGTTWDNVYFSLSGYGGPVSAIPNRPVPYTVYVGYMDGVRFINNSDFSQGGTHGDFGTAGLFKPTVVGAVNGGMYMQGDITSLINDLNANGLLFMSGNVNTNAQFNAVLEQAGMFTARLYQVGGCTGGTPTAGQLVELGVSCFESAAPAGTTANNAVIGILAQTPTASQLNIIYTNIKTINLTTSGAITAGQWVTKSTTAGEIAPFTGAAGQVPIGRAPFACSASASCQMELMPQ